MPGNLINEKSPLLLFHRRASAEAKTSTAALVAEYFVTTVSCGFDPISPLCLVWVRVPSVDSSPTRGTCDTSQVLLAGVPGVFFPRCSPIFAPPILIGPSHSLNNLERGVKLNQKQHNAQWL